MFIGLNRNRYTIHLNSTLPRATIQILADSRTFDSVQVFFAELKCGQRNIIYVFWPIKETDQVYVDQDY